MDVLFFCEMCFHWGDNKRKVNWLSHIYASVFKQRSSPSQQDLFFTLILANIFFVFLEVTPVCATGGQLDQRGAECRRSTGSSFQRSDYSSGRGGSGRRGQVCVTHPPHHSSMSICRFLSFPLFLSTSLCLSLSLSLFAMLCYADLWQPPPPAVILLLPLLSSVCVGFWSLLLPVSMLFSQLDFFFF